MAIVVSNGSRGRPADVVGVISKDQIADSVGASIKPFAGAIAEELNFRLGPALVPVLVLSAPTPFDRRRLGSHQRIGFNLGLKVNLGTGNRLDVFQLLEYVFHNLAIAGVIGIKDNFHCHVSF